MEHQQDKPPRLTIKGIGKLAEEYHTSYKTMKKLLLKVPQLQVENRSVRDYSPKEVEMIYNHLGVPDGEYDEK